MKKTIILVISFVINIIIGCNEGTPVEPVSNLVVVRAYLYANEPVTDIQITGTLPLGSQSTVPPPINNAEVDLIKNGQKYTLHPSAGDSGYYHYDGTDLSVKTGDVFNINVVYNGNIAQSSTEVPDAPDSLSISTNTLYVSSDSMNFNGFRQDTNRIQVLWKQVQDGLFYVTIENLESNPVAISSFGNFPNAPNGIGARFISSPTNNNFYDINRRSLTYYGKHRVKVYRVNQEYADLYRTRQQDTRDLNEPLTNIQNGLGIFSAFSSSEIYFYVVKN